MGWVVVSKVPSLLALEGNRYPVDEFTRRIPSPYDRTLSLKRDHRRFGPRSND